MDPIEAAPVDYERIAGHYDEHRRGGGPYMERLAQLAQSVPSRRFLELGSGTGNNTAALLAAAPGWLAGVDRSGSMLSKARRKAVAARWLRAEAPALPFAPAAFGFVFSTYMLHYVRDLVPFFAECRRVTGKGCVAAVSVPEGFIAEHPMAAYFPTLPEVDLVRFQPVADVEAAMREAGLKNVASEIHVGPRRPIGHDYVARIAGKFTSNYELIPEAEFEAGVSQLRAELAGRDALDVTIARQAVTIWGYT